MHAFIHQMSCQICLIVKAEFLSFLRGSLVFPAKLCYTIYIKPCINQRRTCLCS